MTIKGGCPCGAVTFEVDGDPIVQLYCHCRSCQLAHAAPVVAAAIFAAKNLRYSGEAQVVTITGHPDASRRITCVKCGTKVINEPVAQARAIFPALCTSAEWFKPSMHVQWQDHVLDLQDDLPKYLDYPTQMGGSGQTT